MKIIPSLLFLILCNFLSATIAAQTEDEAKKALATAFAIVDIENARYCSFTLPGEYVFKEGKLVGQRYLSSNFSTRYKPGNDGIAEIIYMMDKVYQVNVGVGDCVGNKVRPDDYNITFNDQQKVVRLEDKTFSRSGKNLVKDFYTIEYNGDRVAKVTESLRVAEAKTSKTIFEYNRVETTYDWKNNGQELTVKSTIYQDKQKAKDPVTIFGTEEVYYRLGKNKLYVKTMRGGKPESIVEYETAGNETTLKSEHAISGETTHNVYTTDGTKVIKSVSKQFNSDNSFKSHWTGTYEYELEQPHFDKENICSYKVKTSEVIYDAQGNVTEERKGGKFRMKNPDGSWGEWTNFRL